jgi:hypothetical protein
MSRCKRHCPSAFFQTTTYFTTAVPDPSVADLVGHLAGNLKIDRLELHTLQTDLLSNGRPHLLDAVPAPDERAVRWKGYGVLCV